MTKPKQRADETASEYAARLSAYRARDAERARNRRARFTEAEHEAFKAKMREYMRARYVTHVKPKRQKPTEAERIRAYKREYRQRPEVKEKERLYKARYRQRPEVRERIRAYKREYYAKPENRERRLINERRRNSEPENRKKRNARAREYAKLPHVRAYRQAYAREYTKRDYVRARDNKYRRNRYKNDPAFAERVRARNRCNYFRKSSKTARLSKYITPKTFTSARVDRLERAGMHTVFIAKPKKSIFEMTLDELIQTQNLEW